MYKYVSLYPVTRAIMPSPDIEGGSITRIT